MKLLIIVGELYEIYISYTNVYFKTKLCVENWYHYKISCYGRKIPAMYPCKRYVRPKVP